MIRVTFERRSSVHESLVRWSPWLQAVEPQCLSIDAPAASEHGGWSVERREGRRLLCELWKEYWSGETRVRAALSSPIEEPACTDEEAATLSSYPGPRSRAPTSTRRSQGHKVPVPKECAGSGAGAACRKSPPSQLQARCRISATCALVQVDGVAQTVRSCESSVRLRIGHNV